VLARAIRCREIHVYSTCEMMDMGPASAKDKGCLIKLDLDGLKIVLT